MKKKIVCLALALTAALGAQLSAAQPPYDPDECFTICPCPNDPSFCYTCCRWSVCPQLLCD
jgi:hypothetical protein